MRRASGISIPRDGVETVIAAVEDWGFCESKQIWLFWVLSGRRSQIEFPTVEVDGVDEVLLIAETARRGLDPLNP